MTTNTTTTTTTGTATGSSPRVPASHGNIMIGLDSLPTYDGTTSVDDFLTIVEGTGTLANWTDTQLVAITFLKLRSKAKQFIDSEPKLRDTKSWVTLKEGLKDQFKRQYVKGAAMKNFIECRQRSGETCRQYLTRLKLLGNRTVTLTGDPVHDDPIINKLEEDITTQFTLGLMMPIKQRVLSGNPQSLDEALKIAEREESIENLIHPFRGKECRLVTSTATTDSRNYNNMRNNQWKCTKCQRKGHTANYCWAKDSKNNSSRNCGGQNSKEWQGNNVVKKGPDRRCYNCKEIGHFARTCPRNRTNAVQKRPGLNGNAAEFQPLNSSAITQANWD